VQYSFQPFSVQIPDDAPSVSNRDRATFFGDNYHDSVALFCYADGGSMAQPQLAIREKGCRERQDTSRSQNPSIPYDGRSIV
jgi:hypothetical protein